MRVCRRASTGSGMHAMAYFRGNKDRCNVLIVMLFSIFDIRSGSLTSRYRDLRNRYIVYRISFNITSCDTRLVIVLI